MFSGEREDARTASVVSDCYVSCRKHLSCKCSNNSNSSDRQHSRLGGSQLQAAGVTLRHLQQRHCQAGKLQEAAADVLGASCSLGSALRSASDVAIAQCAAGPAQPGVAEERALAGLTRLATAHV
jgi:hypothetical protein